MQYLFSPTSRRDVYMNVNVDTSMMIYIVGLAWVFLLAEWLDTLFHLFTLKSKIVPADLNLGQRDAVLTFAQNLRGKNALACRTRRLLTAWAQGWKPGEVAQLSAQQHTRALSKTVGVGFFLTLVMVADLLLNHTAISAIGMAVVGGTLFIRILLLGCVDACIEHNILTRLPATIPGTAMTAAELATALGGSIESAFKNYVPNADKMAAAVNDASERARKAASESAETLAKRIREEQSAAVEKWIAQTKEISAGIATSQKNLEKLASQISTSFQGGTEKLQNALTQQSKHLETTTGAWHDKLKTSLGDHATNLANANKALADQLSKIMTLEKEIQQRACSLRISIGYFLMEILRRVPNLKRRGFFALLKRNT